MLLYYVFQICLVEENIKKLKFVSYSAKWQRAFRRVDDVHSFYLIFQPFCTTHLLHSTLELVGENGARISPLSRRTFAEGKSTKDLQYKFRFVPKRWKWGYTDFFHLTVISREGGFKSVIHQPATMNTLAKGDHFLSYVYTPNRYSCAQFKSRKIRTLS